MLTKQNVLIKYKLFFALLGFSAIVTEIATIAERRTFDATNFFSFFTIEINILVAITFLLSAVAIAKGTQSRWLDILRSMTTVYIIIVGIGFAILLSGLSDVALTAVPWDNTVLHYIIPVVVFIDFLIDRPASKISFKTGLLWAFIPIGYALYSLIRGSIIGWYPYPFLNPNITSVGVLFGTIVGLTVLGIAIIAFVTWLTRFKKAK